MQKHRDLGSHDNYNFCQLDPAICLWSSACRRPSRHAHARQHRALPSSAHVEAPPRPAVSLSHVGGRTRIIHSVGQRALEMCRPRGTVHRAAEGPLHRVSSGHGRRRGDQDRRLCRARVQSNSGHGRRRSSARDRSPFSWRVGAAGPHGRRCCSARLPPTAMSTFTCWATRPQQCLCLRTCAFTDGL